MAHPHPPASDAQAPPGVTAYLAAEGFLPELLSEVGDRLIEVHDRLVLARGAALPAAWAAQTWIDAERVTIASIGDAVRWLRARQRNWVLYPVASHRRAALVSDQLPSVSARPLRFPAAPPAAPLGSFTLLDDHTLLAAGRCSEPVPHGAWRFEEDRESAPSRAYLKLWEAFTRLGCRPSPGQRCLDLGASPGGFTWVLATLGAEVLALDRAPLDPRVAAMPGVTCRQDDAFAQDPHALGPLDWLVCDVACYPPKLLELVQRFLAAGTCERFVCTLKFQGDTDHAAAAGFAALPGARLVHLHHNKHELTFMRLPPGEGAPRN